MDDDGRDGPVGKRAQKLLYLNIGLKPELTIGNDQPWLPGRPESFDPFVFEYSKA